MVVKCFGDEIVCEKAVKGADFIKAYDENGVCILDAAPIVDFSPYVLEGGEWSAPEMSERERIEELEELLAELLFGGEDE